MSEPSLVPVWAPQLKIDEHLLSVSKLDLLCNPSLETLEFTRALKAIYFFPRTIIHVSTHVALTVPRRHTNLIAAAH
jgi:hypothetical protein